MDKKYGSSRKEKEPQSIAHNFNPNQSEQQNQSNYESGVNLGDSLNVNQPEQKSVKKSKRNSARVDGQSNRSRLSRKSNRPQAQKMVSFREMQELRRQQEQSHMGPGAHDFQKPFGSDLNGINFGSKYKFNPGNNPGPGQYEPGKAVKIVHPTSFEAFIKDARKGSMQDQNPDAGQYEPHKKFGEIPQKMTWQGKYKFQPDSNPPPGYYNPENAEELVRPKSSSYRQSTQKRTKPIISENPDAGDYNPHKNFGDIPQKMTWQGKYKFKPDSNPPPGYYSPERANELVRPKSSSYRQSTQKRSKKIENDIPEAGRYDHGKKFGDLPQNMTWQGKYKFQPDSNPPPGLYDPNYSAIKENARKASISRDIGYKVPKESNPDAGQYDPHKNFGDIPQNMTWQGKYKFQPDSNPPPGLYDPLIYQTKQMSPSVSFGKGMKKDPLTEQKNAPGPGNYDGHIVPFGKDKKNRMTWQGKYEFKPDSNPPPGLYDADVALSKSSLPRAKSAFIRQSSGYQIARDPGPSPGEYDSHLKPFGDIPQKMTWQGKYKFVPDSNPPPGLYNPDNASSLVKPRSSSYSPSKQSRVPKNDNDIPEAGRYDHGKQFGDLPQNMTLGGPYKWKPSDTPGPGQYEADKATDSIKASSPSARLHEPVNQLKREEQPGPQVYDGHLKNFGQDMNGFTWGGKYKFQVNDVPPPGYYDPERGDSLTRQRSPEAIITQEQQFIVEGDSIAIYKSQGKSVKVRESINVIEEVSESTPLPQNIVPRQIDDSTQSASPLKQLNS